jgi:pilus assembly protein Flp/PilA
MCKLVAFLRRFVSSEEGPTAYEYAVMLSLIVIVCMVAIALIGTGTASMFTTIANSTAH